ncbi:MAG: prepilin-type N-terminal cleavage/methylation domain-containing protein [Limisphaerales bacterium]
MISGSVRAIPPIPRGFTLVELLVVIAVIALLAALLLPALGRAKERAWTVACLSNLKQLAACWHLYATDHDDHLPPNNSVYNIQNHQALITGGSWCTNLAPYDADPSSISSGHLFSYNQNVGIYRCPADRSTVRDRATGESTGVPRLRSYNLSLSNNGWPEFAWAQNRWHPSFKKYTEIRRPGPAALLTFIEVHEDSIFDSLFGIPTDQYFAGWNQ